MVTSDTDMTYEEARDLARHEDPAVRIDIARRKDLKPELLYFLAEDPDPAVRQAIAENEAAPRQADVVLARDNDDAVRTSLADKIAKVAPDLSPNEQRRIRTATTEVLEILARDQLTRVRQFLSDALKDVTHAPPEVIKRLAVDTEIDVAGPVLEFSPVLTDQDLIEIIEQAPADGGLNAISRRAGLSESVADAVVATDDASAISDLLNNNSAQIREETLDGLVERAPGVELWHAPLAGRPDLPAHAVAKMAMFVADNLLETLQARHDLDDETLKAVKAAVHTRLTGQGGGDKEEEAKAPLKPSFDLEDDTVETPLNMAERLHESNRLGEGMIVNAMNVADYPFIHAALSVASGVPIKVVEKIFSEKSPKGIVALVWKAGFSMSLAVNAQQRMASIAPTSVLGAGDLNDFPLNEEEMNWQIEFFSDLAEKGQG